MKHAFFWGRVSIAALAAAAVVGIVGACGNGDVGAPSTEVDGGGPDGELDSPAPPVDAPGDTGPVHAKFGLDARPKNTTCVAPARPPQAGSVALQPMYATVDLGEPMMMVQRPGDNTRWYVASRPGQILSFPSVNPPDTPTVAANLAVLAGPVNVNGEAGLLGLAFHPKFAQNGRLYVTWNRDTGGGGNFDMKSEVGYLTSADGGLTFTSYTTVLAFDQVGGYCCHKAGGITFGNDGYLYLSFGDGGLDERGQTTTGFFSKILRIDVDGTSPGKSYAIPLDNPFRNGGNEPEVFAYGFRNPFRISIDRGTNELWVGDVGELTWDEIDLVQPGGNYGWSCLEGTHDIYSSDPVKCPLGAVNLSAPVYELEHVPPGNPRAVVGGKVYRGKAMPALVGTYFFADFQTTEVFSLTRDLTTGAPTVKVVNPSGPNNYWVSFAEDADGELYVMALSTLNGVYKLVPGAGGGPSTFPDKLSKTGCVDPADPKKPSPGLIPYDVNSPLWSDGATKDRFIGLPEGKTIGIQADDDLDLPAGSVLTKTFSVAGKRIETRLLVRHDDGEWAGYVYEWDDAQTDATLLPSSKRKTVGAQSWYFPSRGDCMRCHTQAAGRTLGLEIGQLNRDVFYPSTNRVANAVDTLDHIGVFAPPLGKPSDQAARLPTPSGTAPLEARARAYLHTNCSMCHRPLGGGRGPMDLRFANTFKQTSSCNVPADSGDFGVAGAKLVVPGAPAQSLVSLRPHAPGAGRMPPLATTVVDTQGLKVVDDWIKSLTACP